MTKLCGGLVDLRLGDWREVLADVERCDAVITDPPYSARVHSGQRTGAEASKSKINYAAITEDDCAEFVGRWSKRTLHWSVVFSDHVGSWWWERAFNAAGWYVFAPVAWIRKNATPRVAGDGPTSAIDYITVSRPRKRLAPGRSGSRPGFYEAIILSTTVEHTGGKTLDGMRAIVRDYTRPGDLVVDPFCGSGTTALACAIEGRRCITSELDPNTFEIARRRLETGFTPNMF
jgi:DNA modification methylase